MSRAKVSVAIDRDLLQELDQRVQQRRCQSRSQAIQRALKQWLRREREQEIEAYYDGLDEDARADEQAWAEMAAAGFSELSRPGAPHGSRDRKAASDAGRKARGG